MLNKLAGMLALMLAAGCDSGMEPLGTLTFEEIEQVSETELNLGADVVEYVGFFHTPCPLYTGAGRLVDRGLQTIELHVTATGPGSPCRLQAGMVFYRARIRDLDPGVYELRIIESVQGLSSPPDTVVDLLVDLPMIGGSGARVEHQ